MCIAAVMSWLFQTGLREGDPVLTDVCVQVSDGFRGRRVDQPQADGQSRAATPPQTPHPVQWTHLAQSGQEELLHHQVAQSPRPFMRDEFDPWWAGREGRRQAVVSEDTWKRTNILEHTWVVAVGISCGCHINMCMHRWDVYPMQWYY